MLFLLMLWACKPADKGPIDQDGDGLLSDVDCDDNDAAVMGPVPWYADSDGDGHGSTNGFLSACTAPAGYAGPSDDCDDQNASVFPSATELPGDEIDENCDGLEDCYSDADGDLFRNDTILASTDTDCVDPGEATAILLSQDCDDNNAAIHPGMDESCNGLDDDCDTLVDDDDNNFSADTPIWYVDRDTDGFGDSAEGIAACAVFEGRVQDAQDCDDRNADVHPGLSDRCDNNDTDCDGSVDEDGAPPQTLRDTAAAAALCANYVAVCGDLGVEGLDESGMQALSCLEQVQGTLSIQAVTVRDLSSLSQLQSVGSLSVSDNPNLESLSGLEALSSFDNLSIVGNTSLLSLQGLETVNHLDGDVLISNNPQLASLAALSQLVDINGSLEISSASALTTLDGLNALVDIGGEFQIGNQAFLTSLEGLSSLTTIHSHLQLHDNVALVDLQGLDSLTFVVGNVTINGNASLEDLSGLASLDYIGGLLSIYENISMSSISGFGLLTSVFSGISIHDNPALTILAGFDILRGIDGDLTLSTNPQLITCHLALSSIRDDLVIRENGLLDLSCFENMSSLGGDLILDSNASLLSVDGLEGLRETGQDLSVTSNPNLSNIDGFYGITDVRGDLIFTDNAALTTTDIDDFVAAITIHGSSTISGNGP